MTSVEDRLSASWARVASSIYQLLDARLRSRFAWLVALMFVVAAFEMFVVAALAAFVAAIGNPDFLTAQASGRLLRWIAPDVMASVGERGVVFFLGGVMVVFVFSKNLVRAYTDRRSADFCSDLDAYFGSEGMRRIMMMPYQTMKSYKLADLSRYIDWRTFLGSDFARSFLMVLQNIAIFMVIFWSLLIAYPAMSVVIFFGAGGLAALIYRILRPRIDRELNAYLENVLEVGRQTLNCLCGIREIKLFGTEQKTLTFFETLLGRVARTRSNGLIAARLPTYFLDAAGTSFLVAAVLAMIFVGYYHSNVTSTTAVFALVSMRMIGAVNSGLAEIAAMRGVVPFAEQLLKTLMRPPGIDEIDVADNPAEAPLAFDREIELRNVSFRYAADASWAVEDVSARIDRGTLVGLVGSSGCGKSTTVDLIAGLLVPTSGDILVDGHKLDSHNRRRWMKAIGVVAQSPFFFDGTVAQNIAFENDPTAIDRSRVQRCCEQASIEFLDEKKGIDMPLVEGGANLSIGQRQRIAIARALYREAPLLVFDEPTSALDPYNEQRIQDLITGMRGRETVIVIAHRLTTVEACDRVIWLDKGRVVRDGEAREVLDQYVRHVREKAREDQLLAEQERQRALAAAS